MVKPLKPKQRGPRCSWCERLASHRGFMFGRHSCPEHIPELKAWDAKASAPDYSDAAFVGRF